MDGAKAVVVGVVVICLILFFLRLFARALQKKGVHIRLEVESKNGGLTTINLREEEPGEYIRKDSKQGIIKQREFSISQGQLDSLIQEVERIKFFSLPDSYVSNSGAPVKRIMVFMNKARKEVAFQSSAHLRKLERLIKRAAGLKA